MIKLILQETTSTVEKEKKSRIFTRDRTTSSNKFKKSMPKTNENDNGRCGNTVSGGSFIPGEFSGSVVEVHKLCCIYYILIFKLI